MVFELNKEVGVRLTFDFEDDSKETRGILRQSNEMGIVVEIDMDGTKYDYFFPSDRILFIEQETDANVLEVER